MCVGAGTGGRRKEENGGGMDTWAAHLSCPWRLELLREVLFMTEEEGESYIFAVLLSLVFSLFWQVRRMLVEKEAGSLSIVLLSHVSRLCRLVPEHLFLGVFFFLLSSNPMKESGGL